MNINGALKKKGKLYILEMVVPEDLTYDYGLTLNFNLLVNSGGKERKLQDFKLLLEDSGFKIMEVLHGDSIISIISAEKTNKSTHS